MRTRYIFFLFIFTLTASAQPCGGQYSSGLYHNSVFVTTTGDTMNKLNSNELYEGLHLYTNSEENLYNDTISYTLGHYVNGLPVGEWTVHCQDGGTSYGQFETGGGQITSDGKGGWIEKKQGIYAKIGVWKYYDKNNSLVKTLKYESSFDNKGWSDKTYILNQNGDFVLVDDNFNGNQTMTSSFKKENNKRYDSNGNLVYIQHQNFWKGISIEYYPSGHIKQKLKCRKIIGIKTNTSILKKYSDDRRLIERTKSKCWTSIHDY